MKKIERVAASSSAIASKALHFSLFFFFLPLPSASRFTLPLSLQPRWRATRCSRPPPPPPAPSPRRARPRRPARSRGEILFFVFFPRSSKRRSILSSFPLSLALWTLFHPLNCASTNKGTPFLNVADALIHLERGEKASHGACPGA